LGDAGPSVEAGAIDTAAARTARHIGSAAPIPHGATAIRANVERSPASPKRDTGYLLRR
jgi:hypothetical protein